MTTTPSPPSIPPPPPAAAAATGATATADEVAALLDRRIIVLSGKGGVGRTTVAAVLARLAAAAGKRVLIAQTDAPGDGAEGAAGATPTTPPATATRLGRLFGQAGPMGHGVRTLAPGIDAVNMNPPTALHEYGLMVLRSELVYRALFENRAVRGFLGAIPGLDAYAMLGKAWWHTTETVPGDGAGPGGRAPRPRYDLVILDGPASGHSTLMLRIPQAILDAMPNGPLSRDARAMRDLLTDARRAAMVIVTLAEDLPARETAELAAAARGRLRLPLGPVFVNAVPSGGLAAPAAAAVLDRLPRATGDATLDATLRIAAGARAHRRVADEALDRLRRDPGLPLVILPRLPAAELGPTQIDELAACVRPSHAGIGGNGSRG